MSLETNQKYSYLKKLISIHKSFYVAEHICDIVLVSFEEFFSHLP